MTEKNQPTKSVSLYFIPKSFFYIINVSGMLNKNKNNKTKFNNPGELVQNFLFITNTANRSEMGVSSTHTIFKTLAHIKLNANKISKRHRQNSTRFFSLCLSQWFKGYTLKLRLQSFSPFKKNLFNECSSVADNEKYGQCLLQRTTLLKELRFRKQKGIESLLQLKFSKPYIFASGWCKTLIFKNQNS